MMKKPKPCPGCGRARSTCWIMPCLHLEQIKERGLPALQRWAAAGGGTVAPR